MPSVMPLQPESSEAPPRRSSQRTSGRGGADESLSAISWPDTLKLPAGRLSEATVTICSETDGKDIASNWELLLNAELAPAAPVCPMGPMGPGGPALPVGPGGPTLALSFLSTF